LVVTYGGEQVNSLAVSRIVFWNGGTETIREDDLGTLDPLRVAAVEGVTVLNVSVYHDNFPRFDSADAGQGEPPVRVGGGPERWRLKFRYLEPHRGADLQVLHTVGPGLPVSLAGSTIGARPLQYSGDRTFGMFQALFPGAKYYLRRRRLSIFVGLLLLLGGQVCLTLGVFILAVNVASGSSSVGLNSGLGVLAVTAGLVIWALGYTLGTRTRVRLPTGL
jgi:hypothetical protein